jgi:ABC-type antimicrobial peptide transport system permease subunit
MNNVKRIIRSFFKKGQNNFIKISSLGVGMAVAIVLLAKVSFDTQFDDFFPEANHIYQVQSNFKMDKGDKETKKFRDSILVGSIVTLLITLLRLIGYLNSEIQRRTSEIAIRKVNGATLPDILKLFAGEHVFLSPIAILLGCIATVFVAKEWMENFAEKASLSPLIFIGSGLGIFLVIEIVVLANCYKIANQNPVKSLKSE